MKEFIAWDNEDEKFILWENLEFEKLKNEDIMIWKQIDSVTKEGRDFDLFPYIGLTDINNNKIYADCSIVEFDCDIYGNYFTKPKGYFYFNNISLRYNIKTLNGKGIAYDNEYIKNIKIIDTIQENKLGLIK